MYPHLWSMTLEFQRDRRLAGARGSVEHKREGRVDRHDIGPYLR
jgi:hypothetical protein